MFAYTTIQNLCMLLSFVCELADLFVPTWVPTMSTTADPRPDWCGLPIRAGDWHRITGVADVMLQTLQGETLLVAEVKSDAGGSGEFQLLAELRTLQQRNPQRCVLGLLVNHVWMRLFIPGPVRRRRLSKLSHAAQVVSKV